MVDDQLALAVTVEVTDTEFIPAVAQDGRRLPIAHKQLPEMGCFNEYLSNVH